MNRMPKIERWMRGAAIVLLAVTMWPAGASAQKKAPQQPEIAAPAPAMTPQDPGATQQALMELLHVSPTLANVLSSDPSLLADQQYVARSNPELAQFLAMHPEVARNPAFYLFSNLRQPSQRRYAILQPREGFERFHEEPPFHPTQRMLGAVMPLIALILIGGAVLWLVRLLAENRRWGKAFRMQSEAHARLIEKFGASEELLRYMETDAGKRFLEAAQITTEGAGRSLPNIAARVLTNLQVGLVMTLLGAGFLGVRHSVGEGEVAMLVLGMITLMPGLGLILSAGVTWYLGRRMELIAPPSQTERQ